MVYFLKLSQILHLKQVGLDNDYVYHSATYVQISVGNVERLLSATLCIDAKLSMQLS